MVDDRRKCEFRLKTGMIEGAFDANHCPFPR